jgi:hypothetical protein
MSSYSSSAVGPSHRPMYRQFFNHLDNITATPYLHLFIHPPWTSYGRSRILAILRPRLEYSFIFLSQMISRPVSLCPRIFSRVSSGPYKFLDPTCMQRLAKKELVKSTANQALLTKSAIFPQIHRTKWALRCSQILMNLCSMHCQTLYPLLLFQFNDIDNYHKQWCSLVMARGGHAPHLLKFSFNSSL